jgi:predicted anti-sigma-YlaC factor YlaD
MRCHKYERWISDELDGELTEKNYKKLEDHLKRCSSCQAYSSRMKEMQAGISSVKKVKVSEAYLNNFSNRLRKELASLLSTDKKRKLNRAGFRWGYTMACVVIVVAVMVFLFYPSTLSRMKTERYILSFDDAIQELLSDIGDDQELGDLFNIMILASIQDALQDSDWTEQPGYDQRFYEREELSEGELDWSEKENGYDQET